MWTCPECGRVFARTGQQHSCKRVPLDDHFRGKGEARVLFDYVVGRIRDEIGECRVVSIPCCVHLFGRYDFLAALPKKDGLEIRIALEGVSGDPRFERIVPLSKKHFKHCLHIRQESDVDESLMGAFGRSYHLKG